MSKEAQSEMLEKLRVPLINKLEEFIISQPTDPARMTSALVLRNALHAPDAAVRQDKFSGLIAAQKAKRAEEARKLQEAQAARAARREAKKPTNVMAQLQQDAAAAEAEAEASRKAEKANFDAVKNFYLVTDCLDKISRGKIPDQDALLHNTLNEAVKTFTPRNKAEFNKKCESILANPNLRKQVKKASRKYDVAFEKDDFQIFLKQAPNITHDTIKNKIKEVTKTHTIADKLAEHMKSVAGILRISKGKSGTSEAPPQGVITSKKQPPTHRPAQEPEGKLPKKRPTSH